MRTRRLEFFAKAHQLSPNDRSAALMYARACCAKGTPAQPRPCLSPVRNRKGRDVSRDLCRSADALRATGHGARRPRTHDKSRRGFAGEIFLAGSTSSSAQGRRKRLSIFLAGTKKSMLAARRESEFASAVDQLVETYPKSLRLATFWAAHYSEINRETKYFDALVRLFDLIHGEWPASRRLRSPRKARRNRSVRRAQSGAHWISLRAARATST